MHAAARGYPMSPTWRGIVGVILLLFEGRTFNTNPEALLTTPKSSLPQKAN